jgi:deazaflavin-dependent oxidoreductase (nitroreductase family)
MLTRSESVEGMGPAAVADIGPSRPVRLVLRPMTKVFNPLIRRIAGRRHFPMAARIHHVGRISGRPYVTPASARLHGGTVVIPLTFGNRSDWARNVVAAGRCSIRVNGVDLEAVNPVFVNVRDARALTRAAFNPFERFAFRLLGIEQLMCLRAADLGKETER